MKDKKEINDQIKQIEVFHEEFLRMPYGENVKEAKLRELRAEIRKIADLEENLNLDEQEKSSIKKG